MYIFISFCMLILFQIIIVPRVNYLGKKHKKNNSIYDVGFNILPNLHKFYYISDAIVIVSLFTLFIPGMFKNFIYLMIPIFLVRCITIYSTILPKLDTCDVKNIFYLCFFGGCYDKIFSGHFAAVFLITLLLFEQSYLSFFLLCFINILNGLIIISVRNHYTIDVIVSFFVTLCLYQLLHKNKKSIWDNPNIQKKIHKLITN